MPLLDKLSEAVKGVKPIPNTAIAYFLFSSEEGMAFLSQLPTDDLLPLLEQWCMDRRTEQDRRVTRWVH